MRLKGFHVGEPIGSGGMATVYGGRHVDHGTQVAIKVVTTEEGEALVREAHTVAQLNHPHIIRLLDLGTLPKNCPLGPVGSPFYVMERCDHTLMHKDMRPTDWSSLRAMLRSLLSALAHAHAVSIIHCDIKPTNVLFDNKGRPVLADFGIAHVRGKSQMLAGTPSYMAPEQFEQEAIGPWTDLYALGILAFKLCGTRPWPAKTPLKELFHLKLGDKIAKLQPHFEVPSELEDWLRWMLRGYWESRFLSAAAALQALDDLPSMKRPAPVEMDKPTQMFGKEELLSRSQPLAPTARLVADHLPWSLTDSVDWALKGAALVSVVEPRFSGRINLREAMWRALVNVRERMRGDHILLHGRTGSGRARCARWVARQAGESLGARVGSLRRNDNPHQALMQMLMEVLGVHTMEDAGERLTDWRLMTPERQDIFDQLLETTHMQSAFPLVERVLGWVAMRFAVVVLICDMDQDERLSQMYRALVGWLSGSERLQRRTSAVLWVATAVNGHDPQFEVGPMSRTTLQTVCRQWVCLDEQTTDDLVDRAAGSPGRLREMIVAETWTGLDASGVSLGKLSAKCRAMAAIGARLGPDISVAHLLEGTRRLGVAEPISALGDLVELGILVHQPPKVRFASKQLEKDALDCYRPTQHVQRVAGPIAANAERWESAADAYFAVGEYEKVIDCYLRANLHQMSETAKATAVDRVMAILPKAQIPRHQLEETLYRLAAMTRKGETSFDMLPKCATLACALDAPGPASYLMALTAAIGRTPWSEVTEYRELALAKREQMAYPATTMVYEAQFRPDLSDDERLVLLQMAVKLTERIPSVLRILRWHALAAWTVATQDGRYLDEIRAGVPNIHGGHLSLCATAFSKTGHREEALAVLQRALDEALQQQGQAQIPMALIAHALFQLGRTNEGYQAALSAETMHSLQPEIGAGVQIELVAFETLLGKEQQALRRLQRVQTDLLHSPNGKEIVVEMLQAAAAKANSPALNSEISALLQQLTQAP